MNFPKTAYQIVAVSILVCMVILTLAMFNGELHASVIAMSMNSLSQLNEIAADDAIQADFSASPLYGHAPLTVSFAVQTSGDYDVLEWDYGDGTLGGGWNPEHTYTAPGLYNVTLTASNATSQDTETKEAFICVDTQCAGYDSLSYVNHIGGAVYSVAVRDHYAYIGEGYWFSIVDISDPLSPRTVGSTTTLPSTVRDIAIDGDYAYLANGYDGGLRIIDISDPKHPTEVGSYRTGYTVNGVDVVDTLAYVVDSEGLHIIDVSDPTSPVELGSYITGWKTYEVDVVGTKAYMVDDGNSMRIVDVTDPANPFELSHASARSATDIEVVGNHAYIAADFLKIYNIADPTQPVLASNVPGSYSSRITVNNKGEAYLADPNIGLRIYDVSNPYNPSSLGSYDTSARDVAVWGDIAYMAAGGHGLELIDVDEPSQPRQLSTLPALVAWDVDIEDEYAYIVNTIEMPIVDVQSPSQLEAISQLQLSWGNRAIRTQDGIAYIANDSSGLHLVDVSDPTNPFEISVSEMPPYAYNLDVEGDIAYVAAGWNGLSIVDVSDPLHPHEIGRYETTTLVFDVDVSGGIAYLAEESGGDEAHGLRMIDISDPINPSELGVYPTKWGVEDVAVADKTAYIGYSFKYLGVIDVTDPTEPTEIRLFDEQYRGQTRVAVEGDYAYVLVDDEYESNSVRIIDISTPSSPFESTFLEIPTGVSDLRVKNGLIYVASGKDGLVIFSHDISQILYLPLYFSGN